MTTAINAQTQATIDAQKKDAGSELASNATTAAIGFGVMAATMAFFPAAGIVGLIGGIIGIGNTVRAAHSVARIAGLNKAEGELAAGKLGDTKTRAGKIGKIGRTGSNIALAIGFGILAAAVATLVAPALLPAAAVSAVLTTVAWPTMGLLLVSRVMEGTAQGAQAVVNAAEPPAPAAPAAAAPEAAAKPSRFASLKNLFGRTAAPANENAAPAAPEAKPAAPAAPKP
ncbi:MAG: hypothetical protein ACAH80_04575 [Alphaproteobacteria bacterium]